MGRKKIKKHLIDTQEELNIKESRSDDLLKRFIKILMITIGCSLAVFLILNTFMKEDSEEKETKYTDDLGYGKILAQDVFDKPESDYVVFFINGEEGTDEVNDYYESLSLGVVSSKIYVVDMAEKINSKYLVDDSEAVKKYGANANVEYSKAPASLEELEIYKYPTVIRIVDGQFSAFYEGDEFYDALGVTNPDAENPAY
ncbi:MAG: hypothetical protein ACK5NF_02030 [Bacilli bacterium]